jgi:hypothetical protein
MNGKVNRAEAHQSEGGLNLLNHFNVGMATAQFRFDTPQLAAGSFISELLKKFLKRMKIKIYTAGGTIDKVYFVA